MYMDEEEDLFDVSTVKMTLDEKIALLIQLGLITEEEE